jgi:DNA (cytosine-5)-methyltransferase 1
MNSGKDFVVRETDIAQPIMAAGPALGNQGGDYIVQPVANPLTHRMHKGINTTMDEGQTMVVQAVAFVENSRGEIRLQGGDGAIAPQLSTGGGKPGQGQSCIAFDPTAGRDMRAYSDGSSPGLKVGTGLDIGWAPAIAFSAKDHGGDAATEVSPTLRAGGFTGSHANAGVMPAIATEWAVRRLTPTECERLQGFPDGYTDVPWRGKNGAPDGPRYKALGNSMAVNCMRWIGRRIEMVSSLCG